MDVDKLLDELKSLKMDFVKIQDFESAAKIRDIEKQCKENSTKQVTKLYVRVGYNYYQICKMKKCLMQKLKLKPEDILKMPFNEFEKLYDLMN